MQTLFFILFSFENNLILINNTVKPDFMYCTIYLLHKTHQARLNIKNDKSYAFKKIKILKIWETRLRFLYSQFTIKRKFTNTSRIT